MIAKSPHAEQVAISKPSGQTVEPKATRLGATPVSRARRTAHLTWNTIYRDLDTDDAISWQALTIFVPLICLAAAIFDVNRLEGNDLMWFFTASSGYLAALVVLVPANYILKRMQNRSFWVLVTFALAGFVRGFVIYGVGTTLGVVPKDELLFRLCAGVFLAVWVLVGANIVVVSTHRHSAAVTKLKNELVYLRATKNELGKNIDTVRAQLFARINGDLLPAVQKLFLQLDSSTKSSPRFAVSAVQDLIESVVRPLSHRVIGSGYFAETSEKKSDAVYRPVRDFFRGKIALNQIILPSLVATTAVITTLPSSFVTMTLSQSLVLAVFGWNALFLYLSFAKYIFKDTRVSIWLAAATSFALPLSLSLALYFDGWRELLGLTWLQGFQFIVMASSLSFASFWFQALETKRQESIQQLDAITEDQRRLVSALRQEVWVLQKHLASTLHGPIQSVLFASLYRFGQSENLQESQVAELIENLEAAIDQLQHPPGIDGRQFDEVWREISDFWGDVCQIEANIDENLVAELAQNPKALSCVVEVIREGINNAVRHGKAKRISLEIKVQEDLVWLDIKNDGRRLDPQRKPGLGSSLIDDVTHSWQLTDCQDTEEGFVTELTASVVLLNVDFLSPALG